MDSLLNCVFLKWLYGALVWRRRESSKPVITNQPDIYNDVLKMQEIPDS